MKNKIFINKKKLVNELHKLKKEYENKMKLKISIYKTFIKNIEHQFKQLIENYRINNYMNKESKIKFKYDYDFNKLITKMDQQINNVADLLNINEIILNTLEINDNNYFNNKNFMSTLHNEEENNFKNSFNIFQSNLKSNNAEQLKLINEIDKLRKENKTLVEQNTKLIKENLELKKLNLNTNNDYILHLNNQLKEKEERKEERKEEEIKNEIKNEINEEKNDISEIIKKDLFIKDAFCDYYINNSFCVFTSLNSQIIIVYSTKDYSLNFMDIEKESILKIIEKAHTKNITNIRYFLDTINKRDLILSISKEIPEIKIWNLSNFECLLKLSKIYKKGEIYSSCILNRNNKNYILVSNYDKSATFPIYIFDFSIKKSLLNQSNDKIYYIDSFINENKNISKAYVITANETCIKSYDFDNNYLYKKYVEINEHSSHLYFIVYIINDVINLIESDNLGKIRIWNFEKAILLKKN